MGRKRKFTDEQFIDAVRKSHSIRETMLSLGLAPAGGSYETFRIVAKRLNVDYSHFRGQAWNKGLKLGFVPRVSTELILSNAHPCQSSGLKSRLLNEGYFSHECSQCHGKTWLDKTIPLELDHIDGNSNNNNLENLRLLCPNCHALTPTYRGRNVRLKRLQASLGISS